MSRILQALIIFALAISAWPRWSMAEGIEGVLCAADGGQRTVLFDLETGVPVEQGVIFEACPDCTTIGAFAATTIVADRSEPSPDRTPALSESGKQVQRKVISGHARAPPVV